MKYSFYCFVQRASGGAIAVLDFMRRACESVRCWGWQKSTMENLRLCNERQPRRSIFD